MSRPIPEPTLYEVENFTGFSHLSFQKMGKGKIFYDVVAVKATYSFKNSLLNFAENQTPITLADVYLNQENVLRSSLLQPGDAILRKPHTDVYITGIARLPTGKDRPVWIAGVRVSNAKGICVEKGLQLIGPRHWEHHTLGGWSLSQPLATAAVPLQYECGFGGSYYDAKSKSDDPER
jgi:hypothetical protein